MFAFAAVKKFPKRLITMGSVSKNYSAILHFFEYPFQTEASKRKNLYVFKCKVCLNSYDSRPGLTRNLNAHLDTHKNQIAYWLDRYKGKEKIKLSEFQLNLIKYIVTTNSSLTELDNPYLKLLIGEKLPTYDCFRNSLLPTFTKTLTDSIENELNRSDSICLVTDMWSTKSMVSYIAVGAYCSTLRDRTFFVIGMLDMEDNSHTAENISKYLMNIINVYKFDKKKIHCN